MLSTTNSGFYFSKISIVEKENILNYMKVIIYTLKRIRTIRMHFDDSQ